MARIRDYEGFIENDENQVIRIKIVKKSNKVQNDQNIINNHKKKPWKKRRDQIKKSTFRQEQSS